MSLGHGMGGYYSPHHTEASLKPLSPPFLPQGPPPPHIPIAHSFNKYFLSTCCVPEPVLGAEETVVPALVGL